MLCDTGVKRPGLFQPKESRERFGADAAAPESAIDPVPDLAFPFGGPAPNVPDDLIIDQDRLFQLRTVGQELLPVLGELGRIARTECNHRHRHWILLMFEE